MKRKFLGMLAFCVALASSAQFFSNNRPAEQKAPANDLQQNIQKLVKEVSTSKEPVLIIKGIYPTGKKGYFVVQLSE